jgi:hypothetical protein
MQNTRSWRTGGRLWLAVLGAPLVFVVSNGCSSDKSSGTTTPTGPDGAVCSSPGGPESGPDDTHCDRDAGPVVQATGVCQASTDASATDYGDPLYNASGSDDDCKYDVSYSVTPICEDAGVTFTVTASKRTDHSPLTGAKPFLEASIGTHTAPPSGQKTVEEAGGVYQIGPVLFDQPGEWTVRFHFFEECADDPEDSPHGHAAFFVTVP